jgi:hypothetical protein
MNTMQPKKSQTTKNEPTPCLWKELSDDVASRYSGGHSTIRASQDTTSSPTKLSVPGNIVIR